MDRTINFIASIPYATDTTGNILDELAGQAPNNLAAVAEAVEVYWARVGRLGRGPTAQQMQAATGACPGGVTYDSIVIRHAGTAPAIGGRGGAASYSYDFETIWVRCRAGWMPAEVAKFLQ